MTKIVENSIYRYKIKEKLEIFTYPDYVLAKRTLPKVLQINKRTFEKYMYTKVQENYDMPANHLAMLAKFFNCKMEDLINYVPQSYTIDGFVRQETTKLASQLGLTK
jgi:hypothetical protein